MRGPSVTVAVPMLNEFACIERCLDAIGRQTYSEIVEVLIVDGGSTDGSREIAEASPNVRVLANLDRGQASGLNLALSEAAGEIFVRVDGHAFLAPDYVSRCVETLHSTRASMVGGPMRPVGRGRTGRAIAFALASPFGAGPAKFHSGRKSGFVDTVYLGAFRTAEAKAVGGYSPSAVTNEDAEFAYRLGRRRGVWIDMSIHSTYLPRETFASLARQFFRYGRGRSVTVVRHPKSLSPRQLAAPLLVVGLLMPFRRSVASLYLVGLAVAAVHAGRRELGVAPRVVVAMATMHLCWGTGFLVGLSFPTRSVNIADLRGARVR